MKASTSDFVVLSGSTRQTSEDRWRTGAAAAQPPKPKAIVKIARYLTMFFLCLSICNDPELGRLAACVVGDYFREYSYIKPYPRFKISNNCLFDDNRPFFPSIIWTGERCCRFWFQDVNIFLPHLETAK